MKVVYTAALCLTVSLTGCTALDPMNAINSATSSAGSAAGRVIGEAIGGAVVRRYSPQFTQYYTGYLMQMAFNSQGYALSSGTRDYQPGEYTEWAVLSTEDDVPENQMRRALLRRTGEGQEWWQVVYEDNASDDIIIMEALFSENQQQMLRLRTQFPDDEGPQEVPVDNQNYQPPRVLTAESIEGATEGRETIQVPAGRFDASRVRFGIGGAEEVWWLSDRVPGGVVQHQVSSGDDDAPDEAEGMPVNAYTMQLQSYGSGASSRLGS
jgi:hypothetical protein